MTENQGKKARNLDKVLHQVRLLVARAEHPIADGATPEERAAELIQQETARKMADKLMLDYAIQEAQLADAAPAENRTKPSIVEVAMTTEASLIGYVARLARDVAQHTRCQVRTYTRHDPQEGWMVKVYGFEPDVRYFNILYTTLRLHMVGALSPRPDPAQSLEDNAYRLHNIGLNWLAIAEAYGWRKYGKDPVSGKPTYIHRQTQEIKTNTDLGAIYGHAYMRAIKARGEERVRVPAGGQRSFRRSAADGYSERIAERLRDLRNGREPGADLVLKSRMDDVDALYREDNPDLFVKREPFVFTSCPKCARAKSGYCRDHPKGSYRPAPYSQAGYEAGVRQANTASLDPAAEARSARSISRR